jgi:putative endopeptidase
VRKLSQGKNRSEWVVAPQFPNCFYIPDNNSIIISGSFLKALYRKDVPFETNMGMIGFVIAHEISHLFDNNGAQFNENGNVVDWWTDEDKAEFNRRVDRLVGYFKAIHPWEGADLSASILPAEACADMAGMKCILRIAAQRQDFDYDLFFRSFAGLWLDKMDDSYADLLILDSHPMDYLRVNCTLQQFDEFLDFYEITEGDGMYLAPSDRVAIW